MNCLRSIVVILTCERKLINVSGILSLALPPKSISRTSFSMDPPPTSAYPFPPVHVYPDEINGFFQQVLVREFVFVLFLFLVLTFDFLADLPRPLASSSACFNLRRSSRDRRQYLRKVSLCSKSYLIDLKQQTRRYVGLAFGRRDRRNRTSAHVESWLCFLDPSTCGLYTTPSAQCGGAHDVRLV